MDTYNRLNSIEPVIVPDEVNWLAVLCSAFPMCIMCYSYKNTSAFAAAVVHFFAVVINVCNFVGRKLQM